MSEQLLGDGGIDVGNGKPSSLGVPDSSGCKAMDMGVWVGRGIGTEGEESELVEFKVPPFWRSEASDSAISGLPSSSSKPSPVSSRRRSQITYQAAPSRERTTLSRDETQRLRLICLYRSETSSEAEIPTAKIPGLRWNPCFNRNTKGL